MGFGQSWPERQPRPKVKKLTAEVTADILSAMDLAIKRSPVLSALGVQAKARRGRFYIEQPFEDSQGKGIDVLGRISPLARAEDLLLETEGRSNSWSEVAKGKIQKLMTTIENDTRGRFHGLGDLNRSLRKAGSLDRLPVTKKDLTFTYTDSGKNCSVQEALYHYFGVPIPVIAEPRQWYIYGRRPYIREVSEDRVLVDFSKMSISGGFGGTALYMVKDGKWAVFTIKPSDSGNIAAAEKWIKKRGWKDWA